MSLCPAKRLPRATRGDSSNPGKTHFKTASASRGNSVASFWAYFRPVWAVQRPSDEGGIPLQADRLATEVSFPCESKDTQFSRDIVSGIGMRGSLEWVFRFIRAFGERQCGGDDGETPAFYP